MPAGNHLEKQLLDKKAPHTADCYHIRHNLLAQRGVTLANQTVASRWNSWRVVVVKQAHHLGVIYRLYVASSWKLSATG